MCGQGPPPDEEDAPVRQRSFIETGFKVIVSIATRVFGPDLPSGAHTRLTAGDKEPICLMQGLERRARPSRAASSSGVRVRLLRIPHILCDACAHVKSLTQRSASQPARTRRPRWIGLRATLDVGSGASWTAPAILSKGRTASRRVASPRRSTVCPQPDAILRNHRLAPTR
jgi:hypothetical protein